jgi:hypothetical protein
MKNIILIAILFSLSWITARSQNFSKHSSAWGKIGNKTDSIKFLKYNRKNAVEFNFSEKNWTDDIIGHRIEIAGKGNLPPGRFDLNKNHKVLVSVLIDGSFKTNQSNIIIWQFHGNKSHDHIGPGFGDSPTLNCQIIKDSIVLFIRKDNGDSTGEKIEIGSSKLILNEWLHFIIKAKFSYKNGFAKVLINKNIIADYTGSTIYHSKNQTSEEGPLFAFGIYAPVKPVAAKIYFKRVKMK